LRSPSATATAGTSRGTLDEPEAPRRHRRSHRTHRWPFRRGAAGWALAGEAHGGNPISYAFARGDTWFAAIGDVNDAGRWLISLEYDSRRPVRVVSPELGLDETIAANLDFRGETPTFPVAEVGVDGPTDAELVRWGSELARIEGLGGGETVEVALVRPIGGGGARKRIRLGR
jgi:hypothetical protein